MENTKKENLEIANNKVSPIEFLWLGLYAFAGFSLELLLGMSVNLLGIDELSKNMNSILTGTLWGATAFLLIFYAKKKFNFEVFSYKGNMNKQKFMFIFVIIVIVTIATFIGFNGFKPLIEFNGGSNQNIITYLLQLFYYLGETSLIVLCIAFGQEFFEKQFSISSNVSAGGLFLALTWGVMHFFLQGISGGIFTIFFSIMAGSIYTVCNKDFKLSYIFIAIAFIL